MPAFRLPPHARKIIISTTLAVGIVLSGCTADHLRQVGRSASPCRVDAVLYCDMDFDGEIEKCRCEWRQDVRYMLRNVGRR